MGRDMTLLRLYTINFREDSIIMEKLLELLKENYPDVDFTGNRSLVTGGTWDSVDVVNVITEIEDAFGISISMEYVLPENFDSVEKIWAMVRKLS